MKTCSSLWFSGQLPVFLALLSSLEVAQAQTYHPDEWVNNPFNPNPNFGVNNANSSSPVYTNNGVYLGTLYGHSPIGSTLTLENPGDRITLSGRLTLAGEVNPDGNKQFRIGLFYRGNSGGDTNWLGYFIGNPVHVQPDQRPAGLYVRNNPNPGIYASGYAGNAMLPIVKHESYAPGWGPGTYTFSLSVSQISGEAQSVSWELVGQPPGTFRFTGTFTNTFEATTPDSFDYVGFLGGAALFSSASASARIQFDDIRVDLARAKSD